MTTVVEHLTNGVRVHCADGSVEICPPLMLDKGMALSDAWDKRISLRPKLLALRDRLEQSNGALTEAERVTLTADLVKVADEIATLRHQINKLFLAAYPNLGKKVSAGDVETLAPHFFWSATGASVLVEMEENTSAPPTGTPSGESMLPPGATSPTPS